MPLQYFDPQMGWLKLTVQTKTDENKPTLALSYDKVTDMVRTETIRQMPQNYLLADRVKYDNSWSHWRWNPDLAADKKIALTLAEMLLQHKYKYGNGKDIIENFGDV